VNGRWLAFTAAALALLVTSYLACSRHEGPDDVRRSEAEMRAALLGAWQGSAELDGETVPFSLVLQQAPGESKASALRVVGALTSENPALNGAVDGAFTADTDADRVELALRLEDGKTLSGAVEKSALTEGRVYDKAPVGSFAMSRP